jgi:hypothetical protein
VTARAQDRDGNFLARTIHERASRDRAGGTGCALRPRAAEGPHWGMGGASTDGGRTL